ncbi:zinc finger A20 and AN1 domain-containing stress-associated protein 5-like [Cornus florida]|uniref:zinc finger A20 and AN1 domain-containing stress-associated protein 5-like n=1 Tax=Cornus florida TaxID=4283 RepID=UPI00289B0731|nr:zinc finger A20 and AN1 domain-containing stress-associated protein 5-like [Cornus florida]
MAQRTEKEDAEFKVVTLCVNNCGLTANPATNNMCQNCFAAVAGVFAGAKSPRSSSSALPLRSSDLAETSRDLTKQDQTTAAAADQPKENFAATAKRVVNRCSGCRRKVGLTGFRCRCGDLFCSEHRYSDRHECSYDYKSAGREAIARENPVVKAAKIIRV